MVNALHNNALGIPQYSNGSKMHFQIDQKHLKSAYLSHLTRQLFDQGKYRLKRNSLNADFDAISPTGLKHTRTRLIPNF